MPLEHARFLIQHFLLAHGIGQLNEFVYLLKQVKPFVAQTLQTMAENGELMEAKVINQKNKQHYYILPDSLSLLEKPLSKRKLKILSQILNMVVILL